MRVAGHGLAMEGRAVRKERNALIGKGWEYVLTQAARWPDTTSGHGGCSCGEMSPELSSDAARKRWHQAHKEDVVSQNGGVHTKEETP